MESTSLLPFVEASGGADGMVQPYTTRTGSEMECQSYSITGRNAHEPSIDTARVCFGTASMNDAQTEWVVRALKDLHPWRKGPFAFFDTDVDTEWRSD